MLQLTALETAALKQICRQDFDTREALEKQLATATVLRRKNSGAGFFTHLAVDRSTAPVKPSQRVVGSVATQIEGFEDPFLLMLFMTDGYADFLEGATIRDSTVGLDLSTVQFKIDGTW